MQLLLTWLLLAAASMETAVWDAYETDAVYGRLSISYPLDQTLFPPDITAPVFRWEDGNAKCDRWLLAFDFRDGEAHTKFLADAPQWTPGPDEWEAIKRRSLKMETALTVFGVSSTAPEEILSSGRIVFSTSQDEVGAPIFYREVNLPFIDAVTDPTRIRWRFGAISSAKQPPVVLEKLPVCGNCHSFSTDGATLGMDVDYAHDKGSYTVLPLAEEMRIDNHSLITWSDYERQDGDPTFGLLSQVSPCGRYVLSTVKDRSVFVPKPELAFSQLFFPIKGILAFYERETGAFRALPGADDPACVQSNPAWSPDGKYIVFAKSKAYKLKHERNEKRVLLTEAECREFLEEGKTFRFDLYRIPFNSGQGGMAEPLAGASHNGQSNYFAKYSPNGKWIVFCRSAGFMLLQADSELYILPAEGGEPRRLGANTPRMNSWHSWSPNSRWLVFSSKANTPYTQLFLTHIDEEGHSSPPVLLEHFTSPDRAANIPEFVNTTTTAIRHIREAFMDDTRYVDVGLERVGTGRTGDAIRHYEKALALNPGNAAAHTNLGPLLAGAGRSEEGVSHLVEAIRLDPSSAEANYHLGLVHAQQGRRGEAVEHYKAALRLKPDFAQAHVDCGLALFQSRDFEAAIAHYLKAIALEPHRPEAHGALGVLLMQAGKLEESAVHLREAARLDPENAEARGNLGLALFHAGKLDEAIACYHQALAIEPNAAGAHGNLALALAQQGQTDKAIHHYKEALRLAPELFEAQLNLGLLLFRKGELDGAAKHYLSAVELEPDLPQAPAFLEGLAERYAQAGKFAEATAIAETALQLGRTSKNKALARRLQAALARYKSGQKAPRR